MSSINPSIAIGFAASGIWRIQESQLRDMPQYTSPSGEIEQSGLVDIFRQKLAEFVDQDIAIGRLSTGDQTGLAVETTLAEPSASSGTQPGLK